MKTLHVKGNAKLALKHWDEETSDDDQYDLIAGDSPWR